MRDKQEVDNRPSRGLCIGRGTCSSRGKGGVGSKSQCVFFVTVAVPIDSVVSSCSSSLVLLLEALLLEVLLSVSLGMASAECVSEGSECTADDEEVIALEVDNIGSLNLIAVSLFC